jgi:hypothetical protein
MELTKYKPCLNPSEYTGFGYCYDPRSGKWYSDVAVFADDFSEGDITGWSVANSYNVDFVGKSVKLTSIDTSDFGLLQTVSNTIKKFRMVVSASSGTTNPHVLYRDTTDNSLLYEFQEISSGVTVIESTMKEGNTLYIGLGTKASQAGDYATFNYVTIIPLNDDGTIDFSNATEVPGGLGIVGKTYIDADGGAERVEQLPRESYAEVVKGKRIECNELGFTPVVYSGHSSTGLENPTSDAIIDFDTTDIDNTSSMTAGIFIVPEDGIYEAIFVTDAKISTNDTWIRGDMYMGGDLFRSGTLDTSSTAEVRCSLIAKGIKRLYKGDTIYVINQNNGSYAALLSSTTTRQTNLSIKKIGE